MEKQADSGRSMVEMLGVLAIIGILSIGGIAGYKFALNKYQSNEIINEINIINTQMALMLSRPHTEDFMSTLDSPYDEGRLITGGYAFDAVCENADGSRDENCDADTVSFVEEIGGLPKEICKQTVQLAMNLPNLTQINVNDVADETGDTCMVENNAITLYFDIAADEIIDEEEPEEDLCEDGFSGPDCDCEEPRVYDKESQLCSCPKTQPHWDAENKTCDNNCLTNVDCADPDEYCHTPEGLYECTTKYGTCEKPAYSKEYKGYVYTIQLSLVAGQNYCNALGKRLMPVSQMVESTDENGKCFLTSTGSEVLKAFFGSDSPSGVYTLEDDLGILSSSDAACNGLCIAVNFGNGWPSGRVLTLLPKNMAWSNYKHTIICAP